MGQVSTKEENENDNLRQVLESYEQEGIHLGVKFLNQALVAATVNDNHECIGKLIKMGATNIDECIQLGKKKRVVNTLAMLLLMKTALTGEERFLNGLVNQLFPAQSFQELTDHDLEFALYCEVFYQMEYSSTIDALEVAQRHGQHSVHRKLMMLTGNRGNGWSKLNLMYIDVRVLEMCTWLTNLDLSANKLSTLPSKIGILNMVINANLSNNILVSIPASLLQLSKLRKLNLSHNKIKHLPDIPHWSDSLSLIDLSDNHLSSLPMNVSASALTALNLSNNRFTYVPLCICTFTTLTSLDLSDNLNVRNLPCELCMLMKLKELNLNGLKKLKEPPKAFIGSSQKCISYLRSKFSATVYSADSHPTIQLMIVGNPGSGKHTLVSKLQNREISNHDYNSRVFISEWECRPNITKRAVHFRIWIFNSLEDYASTHKCFLSQHSLYLLLFNLKRESEGLHELKYWLESISQKAPYSSVMINGVSPRMNQDSDLLLQQAKMIAAVYENKLEIAGLFYIWPKETVSQLLNSIHTFAASYPLLKKAILREIGSGGERVEELLNCGKGKLDVQFHNQALEFATRMDSDDCVGKIIALARPTNITKCLRFAETNKKYNALAMLLLIEAIASGNKEDLNFLLLKPIEYTYYSEDLLPLVYCGRLSVTVSSSVPIEIARQFNQPHLMHELLMKTNVYPQEGCVYWIRLQLRELNILLLRSINWVKYLRLSRNKLIALPKVIEKYLKQVVKIDLQYNELKTVPGCLFTLPNLSELNLSHNKLQEIPNVKEWSICLTILDLSYNQLSSLPKEVVAPSIRSLDISKNKFHSVPLCVCSFTTLRSLNLSDNSNIVALPSLMGRLSYLKILNLSGLEQLNDPPKYLQTDCRNCIRYLNSKLRSARGFYRMKLMVVGYANRGKSTLVARLHGKEYADESTIGVGVSEWWYRPSVGRRVFHFSIWDFGGQEEYYATHQCFLSQRSLYLLLFNLKHGDKGVEELRPWLNNIALRAPHSCMIIIGTHLDEVPDEERGEIDALLHRVGTLTAGYNNKLQIIEVIPVGLKYRIENIGLLKEAIYNHAANYKNREGQLIMGQKIPASYHALDKQIEIVQEEVRQGIREPIMHTEEFKVMVHRMNLNDFQDDEELKTASLFLITDVGSLLHFDDRGHNLHELYFVDPCWLCDMMSKIVCTCPYAKNGILFSSDIPMLFNDKQFPWKYFEQFLALLDRFEIALLLDNRRLLFPSALPDERPKEFEDEKPENQDPVYSRFIMFSSANTPPGFWSRLLSKVMHCIPKIYSTLDMFAPASEHDFPCVISSRHNSFKAEMSSVTIAKNKALTESAEISQNIPIISLSNTQIPESNIPNFSDSLPFISAQQLFINPPNLLPNIPKPLPNNTIISDYIDHKEIHLEYWQTGLYYKDPHIMFRIESLTGTRQFKRELKDGVHMIASPNKSGKKIIGQLVDLVVSLVGEWYPGLQEGKHGSSGLEQKTPCFECIKQGRAKPYEFKMEECLSMITMNEVSMKCGYFRDDPTKNHTVSISDIYPDLLLQDIDSQFALEAEKINFCEDDSLLLGKGGYGKVYQGKYNDKPVAIKTYLSRTSDAITDLHWEAKILHQLCHPCIVTLIGVCVQPLCVLVLEEAPLRSLEFALLMKKIPAHRLTIFRIAIEVAAGLRYMHNQGIIKRDVKAANVLLWTLDPDSLCHCKLCDFGVSTYFLPIGTRGLMGTKGFIAPEVLHIGKRNQRSIYDHRADIFSLGMLLYQMIARRHPYHNTPPHRVEAAVENGERPELQDVYISHTGYHYLTQVMKACWEENPNNWFDSGTIIKKLCQLSTQMVMCVAPVESKSMSFQRAIAIIPSNFAKAGYPIRIQSELWICCDCDEGTELIQLNIHTMAEINRILIKDNQVQCMALCGNHVWLGSRSGIECGAINIFSICSRELEYNIPVHDNQSVTCIIATDEAVYMGTVEGFCLSYSDIREVQANIKPRCKRISEYPIDGILCTEQYVWIAHTKCICLLNLDDLSLQSCIHREVGEEASIGQLSLDSDHKTVWSAHLGGIMLSAWDAHNITHICDIDTGRHLKRIMDTINDADNNITAMTPVLDTVWVGMATGHIMVFHKEELLSLLHPYNSYVPVLTCIPSAGPCELEKAMVVSGGKQFRSLVEGLDREPSSIPDSGSLIVWEAYEAKTIKQMKLIEQNAPNHLDSHNTIQRMIQEGGFRDGTHVMPDSEEASTSIDTESPPFEYPLESNINIHTPSQNGSSRESLSQENSEDGGLLSITPAINYLNMVHIQSQATIAIGEEGTFNIKLPDSEQTILVRCNKPVKLKVLLSEVQVTVAQDDCKLVYYKDEQAYELQTQENLEEYLRLSDKPCLCVVNTEAYTTKICHASNKICEEEISVNIIGLTEQSLKLMCPKPAQLDALLNEIISLGSLKNQNFINLIYLAGTSEVEVKTQEDFDKYLAVSNRPPLLVELEQNTISSSGNEACKLAYPDISTNASKIITETAEKVTLHIKIFYSEHVLDIVCTKPLRLEAVLDDLQLIANNIIGDQEWQLVYSVDDCCIKIETQKDFEKYLNSASMPTLWITGVADSI